MLTSDDKIKIKNLSHESESGMSGLYNIYKPELSMNGNGVNGRKKMEGNKRENALT